MFLAVSCLMPSVSIDSLTVSMFLYDLKCYSIEILNSVFWEAQSVVWKKWPLYGFKTHYLFIFLTENKCYKKNKIVSILYTEIKWADTEHVWNCWNDNKV